MSNPLTTGPHVGDAFRRYLIDYYHDGQWWSIDIPATSFEDAEERCKQIYHGKVKGVIEAEITYVPASGWLVRFICWWKNRMGV